MLNKKTALLLLPLMSFSAQADWVGSLDVKRFTLKNTGPNLHLDSLAATLGYEFDITDKFKLVPQLTYGIGIGDDTLSWPADNQTWRFELDKHYEVSLRAQYQFTDNLYGFASVIRNSMETSTISTNNNRLTSSRTEWGAAIGVGYQLTERSSVELSYQSIASTDVFSLGYRYRF